VSLRDQRDRRIDAIEKSPVFERRIAAQTFWPRTRNIDADGQWPVSAPFLVSANVLLEPQNAWT